MSVNTTTPEALTTRATDGYTLKGFVWRHPDANRERPVVIINCATSVRCRYYSRFAAYLFRNGFDTITHDYRGIGESRPTTLRGFDASWVSWGRLDFEAVLRYTEQSFRGQPIYVVAHSIGGFLLGFARSNHLIQRLFTMGSQIAFWRDHPREQQLKLFLKWHVMMPLLTAGFGYFPGKRLGWLEDTPKGVVRDWRRFGSRAMKDAERYALLEPFAGVTAPTLAVSVTDDEFGTIPAIERTLSYFPNSPATHLRISPESIGRPEIGHFAFFHDRFEQALWHIPLEWLRHGRLPKAAPGVIVASQERNTTIPAPSPIVATEGDG